MSTEPTPRRKLVEISEVAHKICSDWEQEFVESLLERPEGRAFSDKQLAVIDKIYRKVCESPY